jgi:endonuclease/exonuclease/phosphatase family metal-dependent hydrolase
MRLALLLTVLLIGQSALAARLASYNIRNFDYDERAQIPTNKSKLKDIIESLNADLIAVQEIRETAIFTDFIENYFPHYKVALSNCGGAHGQKLGFVYNKHKYKLVKFMEDMRTVNPGQGHQNCEYGSRPIVIGQFLDKKTSKTLKVLAVHLKAGGKKKSIEKRFRQLDILSKLVKNIVANTTENIVVMGDFNSTEYSNKGKEYNRFKRLTVAMNMHDASSNNACTSYWWGGVRDGLQYPSVLDHILVSKTLTKGRHIKAKLYGHCAALKCKITSEDSMGVSFDEVSDHCPQVIDL